MKACLIFLMSLRLAAAEELTLPKGFQVDTERPDIPHSVSAGLKWFDESSALQARYRARMAEAMKHADGAEIFLLDFVPVDKIPDGEDADFFPLLPYSSHSKILSRKRLRDDALTECRDATVQLLQEEQDWSGGALCHMPIHGVRLYRGETLIFETSICWKCFNYYIQYPDDVETASWVGLVGKPLKTLLMREMPIPQSELDRFEARFGAIDVNRKESDAGQPASDSEQVEPPPLPPVEGEDSPFDVLPDPNGRAYFPKGEEFYYTPYLSAMNEPSLAPQPEGKELSCIRFTWLRSFHDPIAVRVWSEGEDRYIRAVRLAKQQDYSPGPTTKDVSRKLTADEWKRIAAISETPGAWEPLNNEERLAVWGGLDGAQWIFERREGEKYHLLDLSCPKDIGPEQYKESGLDVSKIRDFKVHVSLGLLLLKITELTPDDEDDIY